MIKATLRLNGTTYDYQTGDTIIMHIIVSFLSSDLSCPGTGLDDWIFDDNQGLETSGNSIQLEKRGNYIYLYDLYDDEGNTNTSQDLSKRLKISRHNLMQLIRDWQEKVCKYKPQNVTIIYNNDTFTLETSD